MGNLIDCYIILPMKQNWFTRIYTHFVKTYIICESIYTYDNYENEQIIQVFKNYKVKIYNNTVYNSSNQFKKYDYEKDIRITVLKVANTNSNIKLFKETMQEIINNCSKKYSSTKEERAQFEKFMSVIKESTDGNIKIFKDMTKI